MRAERQRQEQARVDRVREVQTRQEQSRRNYEQAQARLQARKDIDRSQGLRERAITARYQREQQYLQARTQLAARKDVERTRALREQVRANRVERQREQARVDRQLQRDQQLKADRVEVNRRSGREREVYVQRKLEGLLKGTSVQREQYLRNADGSIARDGRTGQARRLDHVVIKNGKAVFVVETTSKSADKRFQLAKEARIRDNGGTFVRDRNTGQLVDVSGVKTRVSRRE